MATTRPANVALDGDMEDLIWRVNDHPEVRLRLLFEVRAALNAPSPETEEKRKELAAKVERWRYQVLNHNAAHLSEDQSELTGRLDLLELTLAGGRPRPRRSFRDLLAAT